MSWWRNGVLYQIYPRSFADSDGDGIGDLRGILAHLDHLEWLGIDGIWLNPTMPSPNDDWGYDVADYRAVHPDLGTLEDLDELVAEAGRRGMRVLLDLVPNHTSDRHAWFQDALSGRDARHRDFYVWADPAPDGGPPNNWQSVFSGPAWRLHEPTGQFYLHNFLHSQPDLNWWHEAVRDEFDDILRFWFDRGIAGFRIDVCHAIVNDAELRDDPPAGPDDHPHVQERGLRQAFSMNRPEVHDVLRRWRRVTAAEDAEPILVGETYVLDLDELFPFYGQGEDELHMAFNFLFVHEELDAERMGAIVEAVERGLPEASWPVYTGSNHDAGRLTTRWAGGDEAKARCALLMLLTLRGTPFLYYGDEIALPDVDVPPERQLDLVPDNRDGCRTPMPWTSEPWPNAWLPMGDTSRNVAAQRDDPGSVLHFVRDLIALRRERGDLRSGSYETLRAPAGAWVWRRGERTTVALNLSDQPVAIDARGAVLIATAGESFDGVLSPWTGVVIDG
jgi:alpha-glucosidase